MQLSNNVSSLTCYALLSAIETDLRNVIASVCDTDAKSVLGEKLYDNAQRRRSTNTRAPASASLASLLDFIDFNDAYDVLLRSSARLTAEQVAWLRSKKRSWEKLVPIRNNVAHSRPLDIDDLDRKSVV